MKIQSQLVIVFATFALLLSIIGVVYIQEVSRIEESFHRMERNTVPAIMALGEMKSSSGMILSEATEYVMAPQPEKVERFEESSEALRQALASYIAAESEEGRDSNEIKEFQASAEQIIILGRSVFELKDAGTEASILEQKGFELEKVVHDFADQVDEEMAKDNADFMELGATLSADIAYTAQLTTVLTVIVPLMAISVGYLVSRSISSPISKLKDAVMELKKGNFDSVVQVKRGGEIGDLASQFEKMRSELRDKEKIQSEFISIASHELRTPVQPILGFAQLAIKGNIPKDEALKVIVSEGKRLQQLANNILDVSRIESGSINYAFEKVDINSLISDAAASARLRLVSGVALEEKLDSGSSGSEGQPPLIIDADRTRIMQVLMNILSNAAKFTKEGTIRIESRIARQENRVHIRISDTGGGIPKGVLPKIFDKFVTKSPDGGTQHGTGLGLYICSTIVRAHGGEISASNNGEGGATLTVSLPIKSERVAAIVATTGATTPVASPDTLAG